jgi:hypothetical protein
MYMVDVASIIQEQIERGVVVPLNSYLDFSMLQTAHLHPLSVDSMDV